MISLESRALCREHLSHRIKQSHWVQQTLAIIHSIPSTVLGARNSKTNSTQSKEKMVSPAPRDRGVVEDTDL